MYTDEVQQYLKLKGKSTAEFAEDVEESKAIHGLMTCNVPEPNSESDDVTPPEGWNRPRYEGGESKWLRLTAEDRAIVTSLAQLANQDLSVHLYNAHTLGRKIKAEKTLLGKGKKAGPVWPPTSWTRWPMKPDDVPRRQFKQVTESDGDEDVWRSMQASRSSAEDLQEATIAMILKQAKEQFVRSSKSQSLKSSSALDKADSQDSPSGATSSSSSSVDNVSLVSQDSSRSQSEEEAPAKDDTISSKRERRASDSTRTSKRMSPPEVQPVFSADDEKAAALLAPIARNMLSNIDKLLTGLHHQRRAYLNTTVVDSDSAVDAADVDNASSKVPSNLPPLSPSKRLQRNSPGIVQSPPKRPKLTVRKSTSQKSLLDKSHVSIRNITMTDLQRRRTIKLGPRDWSDITGIASLVGGFNQNVVQRTAARCASLFGEGVSFRTLGIEKNGDADREWDVLPHGRHESAPQESRKKKKRMRGMGMIRSGTLFCPFESCKRHTSPFSKNWNLDKHLKDVHGIPTPKELRLAAQSKRDQRADEEGRDAMVDGYEAEESDDDIEEGVHVDGYMQEIRGRKGVIRFQKGYRTKRKRKKKRRNSGGKGGGENGEKEADSVEESEKQTRKDLQTDGTAETKGRGADSTDGDENIEEDHIDSSDPSN